MPPKALIQPPVWAIPTFYYIVFGVIEPLISFVSLLQGVFSPLKPTDRRECGFTEGTGLSSVIATHAIACKTVVARAVVGFVSASVLRAIRRLPSQALQEKIARSLLIPLAIGDIVYLFGVSYGIGDVRWKSRDWPQVLWLNVIVGIGIFVQRVCWLFGIGRYVASRDNRLDSEN